MNLLLEEWKGPGEIEVRDIGPHRCLVTFSSPEICDEAMENQLLHSVFDEVRPHWDIFWSLLRRVWIEVMGVPEAKSFSVARMSIGSYQWDVINE
ncbi:hypothetical protein PIB30_031107 [Stylosanthes scabra]|uniref:Uncharacterized protein n=1 Tax=Stylosanthes scabra TaxID=79078 RepID=A0ABU6VCK4_9FABA|nr:hypothetical protein [Stylosanthes scabra]